MTGVLRTLASVAVILAASSALGQYANAPRESPVPDGGFASAAQIGRRVFVAGGFRRISPATGAAVVVNQAGVHIPDAFPRVSGTVRQIIGDSVGGWLLVGEFTAVGGLPIAHFARVAPDRTVDPRYRVAADGAIRFVALAHGNIYLAGDFSTINSAPRRGLAALTATTGQLSDWGAGFGVGGRFVTALSVSSLAVYVAAGGQPQSRLWGLSAARGAVLFSRDTNVASLAASSARVFVGGYGAERPVWAVDPLTGADDPAWRIGLTFREVSGTYGDYTAINALLLDGGRLYLAGYFASSGGSSLAAVDAASGASVAWPAEGYPQLQHLWRIGPAIVVASSSSVRAFDVTTGAPVTFDPHPYGAITTLAAAPEGVVVGGEFQGFGGSERSGLAAFDVDTGALDPWAPNLNLGPFALFPREIATDGTWLFVLTDDAYAYKIDATTGAIVATHRVTSERPHFADLRVGVGEVFVRLSLAAGGSEVGALRIADWTYTRLNLTHDGLVSALDLDGDTLYLAGSFQVMNGQSRPYLAAVQRSTGTLLPWRPAPDAHTGFVRVANGRVWVGGEFHRVGGQRRRGLAELDAVTGAATAWNPDVRVGWIVEGNSLWSTRVEKLDVGPDGLVYAALSGARGPVVSGQATQSAVAFSPLTGRRQPWRPPQLSRDFLGSPWAAIVPDCMLVASRCYPRAPAGPAGLEASVTGANVELSWTLPVDPARTAVRLEVGSAEEQADLYVVDLPADRVTFSAPAPAGRYVARVLSVAGATLSLPTGDVSFVVGPPDVPGAPLDPTAVTEGRRLTVRWRPPATGAPLTYRFEAGSVRGSADVGTLVVPGTSTTFTLDVPVGRYFARVVAVNAAGRSQPSRELDIDLVTSTTRFCNPVPALSPPVGLAASVVGRTVTLRWQAATDGPIATEQHIVAGTAPGFSNVGPFAVDADATSFTAVAPSGTYFVRILTSLCGSAAESNEVQVVIP